VTLISLIYSNETLNISFRVKIDADNFHHFVGYIPV